MCVGVYTSLSLCIIMYTHIKAEHVTFQLRSYIGPCLLERDPGGSCFLSSSPELALTLSSQDGEAWQAHSQNQPLHVGCHFELISEKFHNSF